MKDIVIATTIMTWVGVLGLAAFALFVPLSISKQRYDAIGVWLQTAAIVLFVIWAGIDIAEALQRKRFIGISNPEFLDDENEEEVTTAVA